MSHCKFLIASERRVVETEGEKMELSVRPCVRPKFFLVNLQGSVKSALRSTIWVDLDRFLSIFIEHFEVTSVSVLDRFLSKILTSLRSTFWIDYFENFDVTSVSVLDRLFQKF